MKSLKTDCIIMGYEPKSRELAQIFRIQNEESKDLISNI